MSLESMSFLLLLTGIILIGITAYDMVSTTLMLSGGGPITGRISAWLWRGALQYHRRTSSHHLLSRMVWIMLLLVVILWMLTLLVGWSLIFNAYADAVVSSTGQPAGFWDRVYFAGFALTTLGVGDFRPQGPVWQVVTILAAASGFSAFTLTVGYLLPFVSAGVQKRQLASSIAGLGRTPQQILLRAWHGGSFETIQPYAAALAPALSLYAEQHFAYPVLHYLHPEVPSKADALAVAKLDEVLTILEHGLTVENPVDPLTFHALRHALTDLLSDLQATYIEPADEVPPPPDLEALRAQGLPVLNDEAFAQALGAVARRRSLLLALVQDTGWSWEDVDSRNAADEGPNDSVR
jgi:hypothetical protein